MKVMESRLPFVLLMAFSISIVGCAEEAPAPKNPAEQKANMQKSMEDMTKQLPKQVPEASGAAGPAGGAGQ